MSPADGTAAPADRPPALHRALLGAWFLVMAVVQTWPLVLDPTSEALGHHAADGGKHLWNLWWMRASVWDQGAFPFHTTLVNHPLGMDLYPIEPLTGLLAVALPFVPVVALSNLAVVLNLVLTGAVGAWFGRVLTGRTAGAFVAGTLLQGSAVMAFFVHVGVGEIQHLWLLPLGLGLLVRARRSGRWRDFLLLGVVLGLSVLSGFYVGFYLALGTAAWALLTLGAPREWGRLLPRYAVAAALSLAIVLPVMRTFATSYDSQLEPTGSAISWVFSEQGQEVVDSPATRLEPLQVVVPQPPPEHPEDEAYGGGRYLGVTVLLMALVGVVRRPREALPWVLTAAGAVVLALGSYLTVDGEDLALASGATLRLPGLYLNRLLSLFAEPLNFPVRALSLAVAALAAAAALAVRRWGAAVALVAVVEIAVLQHVPWPWARFTLPDASALSPLADQYEGEGLIDLSLMIRSDAAMRKRALSAQLAHQHPTNTVPIERVEFFGREGLWFVQALPVWEAVVDASRGATVSIPDEDARATRAILRDADLRLVLVREFTGGSPTSGHAAAPLYRVLADLCGEPVLHTDAGVVWRVPDDPDEVLEPDWKRAHFEEMVRQQRVAPGMGRALR